ncbi:MAG: hypothetical protein AAB421_01630 [Patescibacteria group bacterium]
MKRFFAVITAFFITTTTPVWAETLAQVKVAAHACADTGRAEECRTALRLAEQYLRTPRVHQEVQAARFHMSAVAICKVARSWGTTVNGHTTRVWDHLFMHQDVWTPLMKQRIIAAGKYQAGQAGRPARTTEDALAYISASIDGGAERMKCGVGALAAGFFRDDLVRDAQRVAPLIAADIAGLVREGIDQKIPGSREAAIAIAVILRTAP